MLSALMFCGQRWRLDSAVLGAPPYTQARLWGRHELRDWSRAVLTPALGAGDRIFDRSSPIIWRFHMAAGLLGEVLPDNHEAHRPTVSVGWGMCESDGPCSFRVKGLPWVSALNLGSAGDWEHQHLSKDFRNPTYTWARWIFEALNCKTGSEIWWGD